MKTVKQKLSVLSKYLNREWVKCARRHFSTKAHFFRRDHFYTKTFLHEGSFLNDSKIIYKKKKTRKKQLIIKKKKKKSYQPIARVRGKSESKEKNQIKIINKINNNKIK